jgi:hypothetical protein
VYTIGDGCPSGIQLITACWNGVADAFDGSAKTYSAVESGSPLRLGVDD